MKGTRKGSITDVYTQKFDNAWLRHLNCLTAEILSVKKIGALTV